MPTGERARRLRDRWVAEVLQADYVGDSCKVLLLAMAARMTDRGSVSVPRTVLAGMIGKSESRVSERIGEATKAGLLDKVEGGYRGWTATYMAYLPTEKGTRSAGTKPRKVTGSRVPNSGNLSDPFEGGKVPAQPVPIRGRAHARVLKNPPNQPHHDDSRASLDHDETTDSSDDEMTAHSPLAAPLPMTTRRSA